MKPATAAFVGGLTGAVLGTAGLLAWRALRLGTLGQTYTEEVAARTADEYMAQTYGLTPERIRRLESYGRLFGA